VALQDIHSDPDRLRYPMGKTAEGSWQRIGWDEAFDRVAEGLRGVQKKHVTTAG
jgi:anaerobic selenocysteine-containing dehydrogenase